MTQTFNDVQLLGNQDTTQLTVQGNTTQTQPLQVWQTNSGSVLARLTGDGRLQLGNNFGGAADALLQANYNPSGSQPTSVWHAPGTVSSAGTISTPINWVFHELQLAGSAGVSGLHNALYSKLTHNNSGTASSAELRAATFQTINLKGASATPVGKLTGLRGIASNAGTAYLGTAVGVEATISNDTAGSISQATAFNVVAPVNAGTIGTLIGLQMPDLTQGSANYTLYTGAGTVHLGDALEVKVQGSTPSGNAASGFVKLYPKLNVGTPHLYAKDSGGTEYDLSGSSGGASKALDNLVSTALNTDILPGSDNVRALGSQALRFTKLYAVNPVMDAPALAVLNSSGGSVAVGDVGYLQCSASTGYEFLTTTTANLTGVQWVVVIDIGVSGSNGTIIYVATQGKVTIKLNANCAIGNFLTTSTTAKQAAVNALMRHEVFAVCLTANSSGAGGTCIAQLLTGSQYYPASNANNLWTVAGQSDTAWVGQISATPTSTSVTVTTTSGSLNGVTQNAAGQLLTARLWNTTRNSYRLILSISGSTITTVSSTDSWANTDNLTIESQTVLSGGAYKYVEIDLSQSQPSPLPTLIRALAAICYIADASTSAAGVLSIHPLETYAPPKTLGQQSIPVAGTFNGVLLTIPIISKAFTLGVDATGTATATVVMRLAGYISATP